MNIDNFLVTMEVRLNKCYTEEQRDFIKNLDTPGICSHPWVQVNSISSSWFITD